MANLAFIDQTRKLPKTHVFDNEFFQAPPDDNLQVPAGANEIACVTAFLNGILSGAISFEIGNTSLRPPDRKSLLANHASNDTLF